MNPPDFTGKVELTPQRRPEARTWISFEASRDIPPTYPAWFYAFVDGGWAATFCTESPPEACWAYWMPAVHDERHPRNPELSDADVRSAISRMPRTHPNWSAYVRKRLLVQPVATSLEAVEVTVLELSPNGNWVKFLWQPDNASWVNATDFRVLEELPPAIDPEKLARGSNVVAACWWKRDDYTFFRVHVVPPGQIDSIPSPIERVLQLWDEDPRGILFGMNSDGVPLPDAVKGMGPHNRAEFEQQVVAWFAVHSEEAKA